MTERRTWTTGETVTSERTVYTVLVDLPNARDVASGELRDFWHARCWIADAITGLHASNVRVTVCERTEVKREITIEPDRVGELLEIRRTELLANVRKLIGKSRATL